VRDGAHRADEQQRRDPAEDRGHRERDQDPEHADGPPVLDPAPVDRVHAALDDGGADQPADQRMPGTRRQAEPPGHNIPGHRRGQAGANHLNRHLRRDRDDAAHRVGDRCTEEQRAEQIEHRREQDRLQRRRGPRGDQRGDRVGRVVEPVRDGEPDREQHRDRELGIHGREYTVGRHAGPVSARSARPGRAGAATRRPGR
jgi:hypothetical protein